MSLEVEILPEEEWANLVAARLSERVSGRPGTRICLATGTTTRPVYQRVSMIESPEIFLLDEFGGLPADDPARCAGMLRRDLPRVAFQAPDVDAPEPDQAARDYGALIGAGGLDLALVGLGRNGHIGMNEPGSSPASRTRVVRLAEATAEGAKAYGATARPSWGITVGIAELMESAELWLVVTGAHKADVLGRVLTSAPDPELPATFLHDHPKARILADEAAGSSL